MDNVTFCSSTTVDPDCLFRIHSEYRDLSPDGTVIVDSPLIERRGVMHEDLDSAWFTQYLNGEETYMEVAVHRSELIGFCMYLVGNPTTAMPQLQQIFEYNRISVAGYISMICVTESWTRRCIGRQLLSRTMDSFASRKVDLAFAEIASSPRKNLPSMHLFTKAGWRPSRKIQPYCFGDKKVEYEVWTARPSVFLAPRPIDLKHEVFPTEP